MYSYSQIIPVIKKEFETRKSDLQISQCSKWVDTTSIKIRGSFYVTFDVNYNALFHSDINTFETAGLGGFFNEGKVNILNSLSNTIKSYGSTSTSCKVQLIPKLYDIYKFRFTNSLLLLNKIEELHLLFQKDKNNCVIDYNLPIVRLIFRNGYKSIINRNTGLDQFNGFIYPYLSSQYHNINKFKLEKCWRV